MYKTESHRAPDLLAERAARDAEKRARRFYGIALPEAVIDFSLRGRCAGQAKLEADGTLTLRFNRQLLLENLDDFLKQTIPHEVAHLVVNWQARKTRRRPRPHGPEWQAVMQQCFGLEALRCHSYTTTPARKIKRPFLYACNCQQHYLTRIMHNKISNAGGALCKKCKAALRFSRET